MAAKYGQTLDRASAYEKLRAKAAQSGTVAAFPPAPPQGQPDEEFSHARRYGGGSSGSARPTAKPTGGGSSRTDSVTDAFAKSFARQLGTKSGQAVVRGILGSIFGKS
jgi:hypothetical protein